MWRKNLATICEQASSRSKLRRVASKLLSLHENAATYLACRLGDRSSAKAREARSRATPIIDGFSLPSTGTKTARHLSVDLSFNDRQSFPSSTMVVATKRKSSVSEIDLAAPATGTKSITELAAEVSRYVCRNQPDCVLYQVPGTLPSLPNLPQVIEEPLK